MKRPLIRVLRIDQNSILLAMLLITPYADAYQRDMGFFDFYRSMSAYGTALDNTGTTMLLSPDSEFFRFFRDPEGGGPAQPAAPGRLVVRDCGGALRRVLAGADARAVLVRPDRYVLAFLSGAPGEAARLRELFDRYGPRR